MGTTVQLTLIGYQRDSAGEETVTKSTATAEYYEKNGTLYLLYEENPDCSETVTEIQKNNRDAAEIQKNNEDVAQIQNNSSAAAKIQKDSNTASKIKKDSSTVAKIPKNSGTVVHNRIKYKDNLLEVTRNGAINTRMVFESGKEHMTDYATPYGCLKLGILTHSLEMISPSNNKWHPGSPSVPTMAKPDAISQTDEVQCLHYNLTEHLNKMIIRTNYSLTAEGQPVSDCKLEIVISFEIHEFKQP